MIPDRWNKLIAVMQTIYQSLDGAKPYGDRMLARYRQVLEARQKAPSVIDFIDRTENLRLIFDLLAAWDQNTKRASLEDYEAFASTVDLRQRTGRELLDTFDRTAEEGTLKGLALFCDGIRQCRQGLIAIEDTAGEASMRLYRAAGAVYESLPLAQSNRYIVSNAVLLHLLFPQHLMPMDGQHTLTYLYGHDTVLPAARYAEVIGFQQEILAATVDWSAYLDDSWNATPPKLVDNAIIYLARIEKAESQIRR